MKALVGSFNQEKVLVGAPSAITNLRRWCKRKFRGNVNTFSKGVLSPGSSEEGGLVAGEEEEVHLQEDEEKLEAGPQHARQLPAGHQAAAAQAEGEQAAHLDAHVDDGPDTEH